MYVCVCAFVCVRACVCLEGYVSTLPSLQSERDIILMTAVVNVVRKLLNTVCSRRYFSFSVFFLVLVVNIFTFMSIIL